MSAYRCHTDPPGAGGNKNNLLLHRAVWRLSCGCQLWDRCAESGVLFERAYLCSWPCLTSSGGAGAAGSSAAVLSLSPEYSGSPIPSQQHLGEWDYLSAEACFWQLRHFWVVEVFHQKTLKWCCPLIWTRPRVYHHCALCSNAAGPLCSRVGN